ncbi:MAG: hypothetical protein ACK2UW_15415 [Anaerolineales bacterium]|jgi:hypothetical protein
MIRIPKLSSQQIILFTVLSLATILIAWQLAQILPTGIDWQQTYRPAARRLLTGKNPYTEPAVPETPFVAAPWSLIPLLPFAVLPEQLGNACLFLLAIFIFAMSVKKLGGNIFAIVIFILTPPVITSLLYSNIEWMPLIGFVLPPQIGLFFISTKPQTGFAVAIFWLYQAWRQGGVKEVVRVFGPFLAVLGLSFLIFGFWPATSYGVINVAGDLNASLWPASLSLGIAFLFLSLSNSKKEFAMAASPFLSPYVQLYSYSGALAALVKFPLALLATNIAMWIPIIFR